MYNKKIILFALMYTIFAADASTQVDNLQFEIGPSFSASHVSSDLSTYEHAFLQSGKNIGLTARLRLTYFFLEGRIESGAYQQANHIHGEFFNSYVHFYDMTVGFEYNDWFIGASNICWSPFVGGIAGRASGSHENHMFPQTSYEQEGNYWGVKGGVRIDWHQHFYVPTIQVEYTYIHLVNDEVLDGLQSTDGYDTRQSLSISLLFPLIREP